MGLSAAASGACPVGTECEINGELVDLLVLEADTPCGAMCVTVCAACLAKEVPVPGMGVIEVVHRVIAHIEHQSYWRT